MHVDAFNLARRKLSAPGSQSVSESTFSIHAAFAHELRASMKAEHIAMMVKCNRNHDLLFHLIKGHIKKAYVKKHGTSGCV